MKPKKRVFKKLTTVTQFQIFVITKDLKFKTYLDENGEPVMCKTRASAERFCAKHGVCYVEKKHIFFG